MRRFMEAFIREYPILNKKSKFNLFEMEKYVIDKCKGQSGYAALGGYEVFYEEINNLMKAGDITAIKNSAYNGQYPALKTSWKISKKMEKNNWSENDIFAVSDFIDISFYNKNPQYQNEKTWEFIKNIHNFLSQKDKHYIISCEERCLQLFGDEKFLKKDESKILRRLNLSNDDLKMKKYGHMFTYWNKKASDVRTAIILENHSTFFSFKRIVNETGSVFGISPDIIIFGEGKKIIKSMSFLDEIADSKNVRLYYFGDIDPHGYLIYRLLRRKYPGLKLKLLIKAYQEILKPEIKSNDCEAADIHTANLDFITDEFTEHDMQSEIQRLKELWDKKERIAQETISYEYLKNMG